MPRFFPPSASLELGRPEWPVIVGYAGLLTLVVCHPVWPGYMHYDGALAWAQTFTGVQTMTWPPMHTYLFAISRALGAGPGGLLAAQTFLLFFGAALTIGLLAPGRWPARIAMAGFAALFWIFPTLLGALVTHYRDTATASFAVLGLGLWLLAARRRSLVLLVVAAAAMIVSVSLRYNAFPLFVLLAPLMAWSPYLGPSPAMTRVAVVAVLSLGLVLTWGASRWRLPDLAPTPKAAGFAGAQLFDLFGVSACAGRNFLPPAVAEGATVTPDQIRRAYDPRHLQITERPRADLPRFFETDGDGEVQRAWARVIPHHPGCYLAHRGAVFVEQMGLSKHGVFLPAHATIDPVAPDVRLARPDAAARVSGYIARSADAYWRRPALLYVAAAVVAILAIRRRPALLPLMAALIGGCFAFVALLIVASPAADARYIFPTNVICALVIAVGASVVLSPKPKDQR